VLNPNRAGTQTLTNGATYDRRGQVTGETDANGKARGYARNAFGQLLEATDHLGHKTTAQYDARGNLVQLTDATGSVTAFAYDRNDRVATETLPLGQTTRYKYDTAGNLTERTDPNGAKTAYTLDAANRITEVKQYKAGTQLQRTTTYTWDAADNLTAWADTDTSVPALGNLTISSAATFDDANRKTTETVTYPAGNTLGYGYAYSAAGTKTQLTWPDGTALGYAYSAHGELETVTIPGEGSISVNQFKWFAPAKLTLPGGSTQERTLDGLLNLEGLSAKTPGQQTVLSLTNAYGLVQELKTSTRTDAPSSTTASTTKSATYTYDDETRLTQSVVDSGGFFGTDTETFTLDAVANRTAHSRQSGAWAYDANHRLTRRGSGTSATSYQYDEAGNLTKKTEAGNKITQFGYDTHNRLVEVKDGSGNLIARYGYDPLHRRIWREQYRDRDGNALAQAMRTLYLYADEGLIAEATQAITLNADQSVSAAAAPVITTQYGPRPNAPFTTGVLFIKTKNSNGQDTVGYYHHDHLGTPIQATDKTGRVVWAASYNVFGQASVTTPAATSDLPTIESKLRLPGQVEDAETGLHYNYFRYYDSGTGRYITEDPIGLEGGINRYNYVDANPLSYFDPWGLWAISIGISIGPGGQMSFGRDPITGRGFIDLKVGWGLGATAKWDPLGGLPHSLPQDCGRGGIGVRDFLEVGKFQAGPFDAKLIDAKAGINFDITNRGRFDYRAERYFKFNPKEQAQTKVKGDRCQTRGSRLRRNDLHRRR
jgi:RHS repeat-associated protein